VIEELSPDDELLELCLDLRAWAAVHGSESARLRTERDQPLPEQEVAKVEAPAESVPAVPAVVSSAAAPAEPRTSPNPLGEQLQSSAGWTLHNEGAQVVFGCGSEQAEVVFVADAQGYYEDAQEEPFSGEAGLLFDRIIENVLGLQRSAVYIFSVVKCRPPEAQASESDEVAVLSPFIVRKIDLLRPVIVVALGDSVAQALLQRNEGIAQLRGKTHSFKDAALIPTYHPVHLLRAPGDKRKVFEDMQMLRRVYAERTGRELPSPPPRGG
jgi:uracil-DNA glycosylase